MLVSVSGRPISTQIGNTVFDYPTGTVVDTFDLSGVTTGANGYLVILENGNTYNNYPDFGGQGLVNPQAAVLDNGINPDGTIAIGSGAGFGNNSTQFVRREAASSGTARYSGRTISIFTKSR